MHKNIDAYIIRNWHVEDAPSIAKYANNKKIWINLRDAFPHPYGLRDAESFISKAIEDHPETYFAISTSTEAIGSIGVTIGKDVHRFSAELGYWLAEPFWGQGIMPRAVKLITEYAIEELGLHRIYAEPYAFNTASAKVLEKAGFFLEGTLRSSAYKDGRFLDQHLYSYIREKTAPSVASAASFHAPLK